MVAASLTESCVMCCVAWCRYYFNLQQTHKTQELPGLVVLDIGSVAQCGHNPAVHGEIQRRLHHIL